jgi:hypothetical protein
MHDAVRHNSAQPDLRHAAGTLAFHSAWDPTSGGHVASSAGNRILWSKYPSDIRKWISRHGGLQSRIIYLHGPELFAMYRLCRQLDKNRPGMLWRRSQGGAISFGQIRAGLKAALNERAVLFDRHGGSDHGRSL